MPLGFALLVSTDPVTIQQFRDALHEWSISLDICQEVSATDGLLNRKKFDAVIVDRQLGERSGQILDEVRRSPSNRTAVTFAISDNPTHTLVGTSSEFVFERPLSTQSIHKVLKPAYGSILRERRRYFRCPITVPVVIRRRAQADISCNSMNISEGGMALRTSFPFQPGETLRVQFVLPGQESSFLAELTICWRTGGEMGVRFISLSQEQTQVLQEWLSRRLEEMVPDLVASKFRPT